MKHKKKDTEKHGILFSLPAPRSLIAITDRFKKSRPMAFLLLTFGLCLAMRQQLSRRAARHRRALAAQQSGAEIGVLRSVRRTSVRRRAKTVIAKKYNKLEEKRSFSSLKQIKLRRRKKEILCKNTIPL